MNDNSDLVAPMPWIVEETPNGAYLRGSDGKRFAIMMGIEANRSRTAHWIANRANEHWLQFEAKRNSPVEVDGE